MEQERVPQLMRTSQLRIGLLVASVNASKHVYDFVKWAQTQHEILEITHLILHNRVNSAGEIRNQKRVPSLWENTQGIGPVSTVLYQRILETEKKLLSKDERHKSFLNTFDLSSIVLEQIVVTSIDLKSGHISCDENAICRLKNLNLDLLINFGNDTLHGDILQAARLGVISIRYADDRICRGDPSGFWEVYLRQDTTGFIIQRLTQECSVGDVLIRGNIQTSYYYLLNKAVLIGNAMYYLKCLIKKTAVVGKLPDALPRLPYSNKAFRPPTAYQASNYLLRLFAIRVRNNFRQWASIDYRWHVSYTVGDWRNAVLWRGIKIDCPRSHFLADPFVLSKSGKNFCFVEDYDFQGHKGKIDVYELSSRGAIRIGTALEEAFHLSFPYIFEYRKELYMCPETSGNRDIRIYKCAEFPLGWKLEKVVMQNISAADTMLFEKDAKWWMFTNIDSAEMGDHLSELSIFYSKTPFGDWKPHPLNPIMVDASRSRNAGLVRDGDSYFRISQGQGFDTYGKRTLINEITELTDSSYSERTISVITSAFANSAVCTHHFHSNGLVTVFDFAILSRMMSWTAIFRGLIRSLGSRVLRVFGLRTRWPFFRKPL